MEKILLSDSGTKISTVNSQYPEGLIGLPGTPLFISWKVSSDRKHARQFAYQIQVGTDATFKNILGDTGVVESNAQIALPAPAPKLVSRETQYIRVKVKTELGWTDWSDTLICEAGLNQPTDWIAKPVGDTSSKESPSPILRREVFLKEKPVKARLYATSMGVHELFINGSRVANSILNPGWTSYKQRLLVETHDVTSLLSEGQNCLGGILSDGWWRGNFGFMGQSEHYGKTIALLAQIEVVYPDGSVERFGTDESWKCSTAEVRFSSIYDGSTIDFNFQQTGWNSVGFDDSLWESVVLRELDYSTLQPRIAKPVAQIGEFAMAIEHQPDRLLLRGTQNIAGWVKLTVEGKRGQSITVRHAEVLEKGDLLHTKALRSAKATDVYLLDRDGEFTLEPRFTFHGFQHADVVTEAKVLSATAIAISSENSRRGNFECSDQKLNRLHENVVWSQLDNFVSIPTDCPQRDERMGWTGDAQAFCNTANTLFDTASFWRSWLIDLGLEQFENGDVSAVVPDILKPYPAFDGWIFEGRAGWGDAATIIPLSVYDYFGDTSILSQQLVSMRRWVDALDRRRKGERFLPREFQFGDWCDPDAPGDKPWLSKVSPDFVANSFFAHSAALLARAEAIVGEDYRAVHYSRLAEQVAGDTWDEFGSDAVLTSTGCSIALEFNICPADARQSVADALSDMVEKEDGMITSGFLGTPLVLHALSKTGHVDSAYRMLMRRNFRSWLYAVDKGATTMWERWDAIQPDGSIHSGSSEGSQASDDSSMISFNHYAYGAVVDWMYRNLGGLAPIQEHPGFRKVHVAPRPPVGISHTNVSLESPYGNLILKWRISGDDNLDISLVVPFGVSAFLDLPCSAESRVYLDGNPISNGTEVGPGNHKIQIRHPALVKY
ncbi:MAG: family 78 glycoside hydrolase catalytic domain [Micrococcales bacterium]